MSLLTKLGTAIAGIAGSKPVQKNSDEIIKTATKVTGSSVAAVGGNKAFQKSVVVASDSVSKAAPTVSGKVAKSILKVGGAGLAVSAGGVAVYDYLKNVNAKSDYTRDYAALVDTYKNETDALKDRQSVLKTDGSSVGTNNIGSSGSNGSNASGGSLLDYLNQSKATDSENKESDNSTIKWAVGGAVALAVAGLVYSSMKKKKGTKK